MARVRAALQELPRAERVRCAALLPHSLYRQHIIMCLLPEWIWTVRDCALAASASITLHVLQERLPAVANLHLTLMYQSHVRE